MKTHKIPIFINVYTCLQGFNIVARDGSKLILYLFFIYWFIICIFASWLRSQIWQLKKTKPFKFL